MGARAVMTRTFFAPAMVRRLLIPAVAALALGITAPRALAIDHTYKVTVQVSGAGNVTDAYGVNCTGQIAGTTSGTCTSSVPADCETIDFKPVCTPGEDSVTAHDVAGSGFAFDHWAQACTGTSSCELFGDGDKTVTAVFRDIQPPSVTLAQPGSGARAGTIALAAAATDNVAVSRVDFSIRGVVRQTDTSAPYSGTFDTHTLADGPAAVTATAYDTSNNMTVSSTSQVTIDNTAPTLTVTGPSNQTFAGGSTQSWTIAAGDATSGVASVQCSVVPTGSPAGFGPCSAGQTGESVTNRPQGSYTLTVRVTDAAGNTVDQTRAFAIDTTPPDTSFTSGVADGATTTATALTWALASTEPATFECRVYPAALTPGAFAPCSAAAAHTASGFAPGTYTIEARAIDAVGNADPTPAKRTFTVAQPTTTSPDPGPGSSGGPTGPTGGILGASAQKIVVTLAFNYTATRRNTRLTTLTVKNVPSGATVRVRCPKGCAKKTFVKRHAHGSVSLKTLVKGRKLKPGTRITVTVSKPGAISAVKVLTIRARKSPAISTLCQAAGAAKPSSCTS